MFLFDLKTRSVLFSQIVYKTRQDGLFFTIESITQGSLLDV